ncbi:hypothetical protein GALMADRAFT_145964 [Galerina marginata CBS 339.88]|uniref:Uncharacterized protein n=1 Tax=Galerina marginata (strain CBS 339.88) TaxID=685588 RepID=A0A067SG51_GALM3|nr:hypothetical protein GALMADRAFT_145964 [Galerina marginata CBS 339.88]
MRPANFWFSLNDKVQHQLEEVIYAVAISPNGTWLLTGGSSRILRIWSLSSGRLNQSIHIGSDITAVSWVAMNWRCHTFWVGSSDGSGCLYFAPTPSHANIWFHRIGWRFFMLKNDVPYSPFSLAGRSSVPGPVESLAACGNIVAVVGNKDIEIWKAEIHVRGFGAGSITFSLSSLRHDPKTDSLESSPLLDSSHQFELSMFTGKRVHTVHFPSNQEILVSLVDSNPAGLNSIIASYHLKPWKLVKAVSFNRRVGSAALSEDGRTFAFTNLLNGVEIFALPRLNHCGTIAQAIHQEANVTLGIAFLSNEHIVVGGFGGICIYQVSSMSQAYSLQNSTGNDPCRCISVVPTRNILAAGSSKGVLAIWTWKDVRITRFFYSSPSPLTFDLVDYS